MISGHERVGRLDKGKQASTRTDSTASKRGRDLRQGKGAHDRLPGNGVQLQQVEIRAGGTNVGDGGRARGARCNRLADANSLRLVVVGLDPELRQGRDLTVALGTRLWCDLSGPSQRDNDLQGGQRSTKSAVSNAALELRSTLWQHTMHWEFTKDSRGKGTHDKVLARCESGQHPGVGGDQLYVASRRSTEVDCGLRIGQSRGCGIMDSELEGEK